MKRAVQATIASQRMKILDTAKQACICWHLRPSIMLFTAILAVGSELRLLSLPCQQFELGALKQAPLPSLQPQHAPQSGRDVSSFPKTPEGY